MELVSLNGTTWVVGLRWEPPLKQRFMGNRALLNRAQEMDESFDASASYTAPQKQGRQYGFGAVGDAWAHFATAPALCSCLDVPDSFLGLFSLRSSKDSKEFWWIHLRIGGVLGEFGDQMFSSREDAGRALAMQIKASGLKPELHESPMTSAAWLEERLRFTPLDKWVLAKGHLSNLHRLASRSTVNRMSGFICTLAIILCITLAWNHFAEQAALDAARLALQAKLQRKADMESNPEKFFTMEWQQKALSTDFAANCLPAMMALPLASNGWELSSAVCHGEKLNIEWKYASGAGFLFLPEGARLDEKNERKADSIKSLGKVPLRRPDGPGTEYTMLLRREEATGMLAEITQSTGTKLSPPRFQNQKTTKQDNVTVTAPWHEAVWELSSIPDLLMEHKGGPDGMSLFEMLAEIPGLSLSSITFNGSWSMKGHIYAKH